jgi:nicotinamidase-related amidase
MNKTALLIVDMIYDFTNKSGKVYYPKNEEIIVSLNDFIKVARQNDCLIVFVEHTVKKEEYLNAVLKMRECCIEGSGGELTDERLSCNRKKDIIIKKTKYSSFYKTKLDEVLKENHIENLLLTGTKTNNCILATTFDAYNRNYSTYVVSDLVGTSDDLTNAIYLRDINKYLAKVISSREIIKLFDRGDL